MNALTISLVVLQIILSLILILVVLLQHGTQTGLSGSIAGGAETFFGKNKGRTIDAKLKKWTSFVAILFLVSSIAITFAVKNSAPAEVPTDDMDLSSMMENMPADDGSVPVEDVTEQQEGAVEGVVSEEEPTETEASTEEDVTEESPAPAE